MRKLTKLNIDALKNENPVLSTIEERMITGGWIRRLLVLFIVVCDGLQYRFHQGYLCPLFV